MKLAIYSVKKEQKGSLDLPLQFNEPIRKDLIKLGVLAIQSNTRQAYGANPRAGQRASAKLSRRRRNYKGSYGIGISRVPRKIMSARGTRMMWVGAVAPGTVGGRRAHPPKAEKIWAKKLNDKQRLKALRGALAATLVSDVVASRGHMVPKDYPFCVESAFESIAKTKDVQSALEVLGFGDDVARCATRKIRAGKGKNRARPYRVKKGPLLVVSKECALLKSARNIVGVDVVEVSQLNLNLLAPGTHPGRLTLFTEDAIKHLGETGQFMQFNNKRGQDGEN